MASGKDHGHFTVVFKATTGDADALKSALFKQTQFGKMVAVCVGDLLEAEEAMRSTLEKHGLFDPSIHDAFAIDETKRAKSAA